MAVYALSPGRWSPSQKHVIVDRHIGEATVPEGWSAGHAPLLLYTWHLPYSWGNITEKPQQGIWKVPSCTVLGTIREVKVATVKQWPTRLACWSWSPLWLKQPRYTLISIGTCQVAKLRISPHQLTLSQNSQLRLQCGQQRMELPNPREFSCYQCTRVHPCDSSSIKIAFVKANPSCVSIVPGQGLSFLERCSLRSTMGWRYINNSNSPSLLSAPTAWVDNLLLLLWNQSYENFSSLCSNDKLYVLCERQSNQSFRSSDLNSSCHCQWMCACNAVLFIWCEPWTGRSAIGGWAKPVTVVGWGTNSLLLVGSPLLSWQYCCDCESWCDTQSSSQGT
jgi:hypothetical protein